MRRVVRVRRLLQVPRRGAVVLAIAQQNGAAEQDGRVAAQISGVAPRRRGLVGRPGIVGEVAIRRRVPSEFIRRASDMAAKKQGRQRSMTLTTLPAPDIKLACAIR